MAEVRRMLGSVAHRLPALKTSSSPLFSKAECPGTAACVAWICNSEAAEQRRCEPVLRPPLPGKGGLDTGEHWRVLPGKGGPDTGEHWRVLPGKGGPDTGEHWRVLPGKGGPDTGEHCRVLPGKGGPDTGEHDDLPWMHGNHCEGIPSRLKGSNGDATWLLSRITCLDLCSLDWDVTSVFSPQVSESVPHLYQGHSMVPVQRVQVWRMVCWEDRRVVMVKVSPEISRWSPQCRVISTFTGRGSGLRLAWSLPPPAGRRGYCSRTDPSLPPLHRSRTAYYDVLRVTPSATQSQIKTAYYKQSFLHHPDKNPGDQGAVLRFSEISEAYSVLGSVALRRKYDRGILSQADVQGAGRPSARETTATSRGGQQQQRQQHTSRTFYRTDGKPIFDFDAFYRAHYGEQLEREKQARERRERRERQARMQEEDVAKWKVGKMLEMTVIMLLATGSYILVSLRS